MVQVGSPYGIIDSSGNLKPPQFYFLFLMLLPTLPQPIPTPGGYQKPNTLVPLTMDNVTRSLTHQPANDIAQPPTLMQAKTTWALSRLLLQNQPGLKEFIPLQRPLPSCNRGGGDVEAVITLTGIRVPN